MNKFARNLLPAAILAGLCCGRRWPPISRRLGNGPTNILSTKSPAASRSGINRAFRRRCAVMGKRFFTLSQKEMQSLGYARHDLNLTGFGT